MVLMVSETPAQDANLKDLPQSFIFLKFSLFSQSPGQKAIYFTTILLDLLEVSVLCSFKICYSVILILFCSHFCKVAAQ